MKAYSLFRRLCSRISVRERSTSASSDQPANDGGQTIEDMSHADLIKYARALDVELARLTMQHARPLGRAVKFARMNAHRRELGVTTEFGGYGSEVGGYHSAFHVVFELAEQALRRARADRQVERQLARQYPEATAALVAMRRYVLRDALDWPPAARLDYERNILADALGLTPHQFRHERMEYWAAFLDVFPSDEFDVAAKASQYPVDDGAMALEEGVAAGRRGEFGSEPDNRYNPGTFLHAKWTEGYWRGWHETLAGRCGTDTRADGAIGRARDAQANG